MTTRTTTRAGQRTPQRIVPWRSLTPQRSLASQREDAAPTVEPLPSADRPLEPQFGHSFGQIRVHPPAGAPGNGSPAMASCPLSLATPQACPFGGACHSCPAPVQAKQTVSGPDDPCEQEADRVADWVMRIPCSDAPCPPEAEEEAPEQELEPLDTRSTAAIRRQVEPEKEEEEEEEAGPLDRRITETIRRKVEPEEKEEEEEERPIQLKACPSHALHVPEAVRAQIEIARGRGRPLSAATRSFFEPLFGRELGSVRLHQGSTANRLAKALRARAFTTGPDIFVRSREASPESFSGRQLLAHELTHVAQQAASGPTLQRACDPTSLAARSEPIFFPKQTDLMEVFDGTKTLSEGAGGEAVRLAQQALVDLDYDLGTSGAKYDGVDGSFRSLTTQALEEFQIDETVPGAAPGVLDQATLKCLDHVRAQTTPISHKVPLFFPHTRTILRVFADKAVLKQGMEGAAVGLVQQALVDLCYDLGTTGPQGNGVDKDFGDLMVQAVKDFQADEPIPGATAGVVDQDTLIRLDEVRAHVAVPCHQVGLVPPKEFQFAGLASGTRDEDLFFRRGSAVLEGKQEDKIEHLAAAYQCSPLTLKGYISEDERLEYGTQLAVDRVQAVDTALAWAMHDVPGLCPVDPLGPSLRELQPLPEAGVSVADYRAQQKVEVVPAGAVPTTATCSPGAARHRQLDDTERPALQATITKGLGYIDQSLSKLTPGNVEGENALSTFFGGPDQLKAVTKAMKTWRKHLDKVVRKKNRRGTPCDSSCSESIAYNNDTGSSAMMTLCESFFKSPDTEQALTVIHEGNHGALGSEDIAYGESRLIHFIGQSPKLALKNCDSYVFLVKCLAGLGCALPARADTPTDLDAGELQEAQEGIAWLETWLTWAQQDLNGVYTQMAEARDKGAWTNLYYGEDVLKVWAEAFDFKRPKNAPPTVREQLATAAIWDRFRWMEAVAGSDLEIEKETSTPPQQRWLRAGGIAGQKVLLGQPYFDLATPRERVETLLPMIVEATSIISSDFRSAYVTFVIEDVKRNWENIP